MQGIYRFILFLGVLLLGSCYEKKEGCIDIYATNFTAEADINCCCQYPKLQLNFSHQLNGEAFESGDTVVDVNGVSFRFINFTYYLADFVFKDASGNQYATNDTFHLPVLNNYLVMKDDIALIRPSTTSVSLGSFKQLSALETLDFRFGPPDGANDALITLIPDSRSLSVQAETLYVEGKGYTSIKVDYTASLDAGAPVKSVYIYQRVPLSFNVNVPAKVGSNTCLSMAVNYAYWFNGVDVVNDDENTVANKIINNLKASMLIKSCD